jgi:tRNA threonylcarbamoyladenosine biosynthesis protein TsaE
MNKMTIQIADLTDIHRSAKEFLDQIGNSHVFCFEAEMGAGKTTFILAVLAAMGIDKIEGSPTYSLVNTYDSQMFGRVYHFDVYRLENEIEAFDIGIEEMLYGEAICFIEWPEKIKNLIPDNAIWVYIRRNQDNSRTITIQE